MDIQLEERVARLQRPKDSQPPDDRNFGNGYKLEIEPLEFLNPRQWLDDSLVNCFIRSLCLARPGECVAFDSSTLSFLLAEHATAVTQAEVDNLYEPHRILAATVTGNRGLVFMPFCEYDHWILIVADFQYQVIRVYDSLVEGDEHGRIEPSARVDAILPHVWATLSFCIEEAQWPVERLWLPIRPTFTECGVYICLMALQHAWRPRFTHRGYVTSFPAADRSERNWYQLDECYWLVGRMTILEVCRRYLQPSSTHTQERLSSVEQNITDVFRHHFLLSPTEGDIHQRMPYFRARSLTIHHVLDGLTRAMGSIGNLESTQHLPHSELIQHRARGVVLMPLGEPFRNKIVDEAVAYAWHDREALRNLGSDLKSAWTRLYQEQSLGLNQLQAWRLWEDWVSQDFRVVQMMGDIDQARLQTPDASGEPDEPGSLRGPDGRRYRYRADPKRYGAVFTITLRQRMNHQDFRKSKRRFEAR